MPRAVATPMTDAAVRHQAKPGHYAVGGVAGLMLQVTPTGRKSWIIRLTFGTRTNRAGSQVQRRIDFGLGPYPQVSLKRARELALVYRVSVRSGIDPREVVNGRPPRPIEGLDRPEAR